MGNRGRSYRDEASLSRIEAAWARIAQARDLDFGEPPPRRRDREEEATVRLETWAARLEMVAMAITGEAPSLDAMTRKQLDTRAADLGIEGADALPNKAAVIEAIEEALTAPGDDAADDGPLRVMDGAADVYPTRPK